MTNKILELYHKLKQASDDYYISDLAAEQYHTVWRELESLGYDPLQYPSEKEE